MIMKWFENPKPVIGLAPMADFTDPPFCRVIRECGGSAVLFREMVSAEALIRGNKKTIEACAFAEFERPIVLQLFGSDPTTMAKAAIMLEELYKPDGIDINMGCPVPKAVSQSNGAALMREPILAKEIVIAVKDAINVPLSVKTRLGWSDPEDAQNFLKILEAAGADALEIHARTKVQGYSGYADWKMAGKAIKNVKVPVLINGDVIDPQTAKDALEQSQAQGFLIGRGALGRPWIFKRIDTALQTGNDPKDPDLKTRLDLMLKHAEYQVEYYGKDSIIKLRKHLPWYLKGMAGFRRLRTECVRSQSLDDIKKIVENCLFFYESSLY